MKSFRDMSMAEFNARFGNGSAKPSPGATSPAGRQEIAVHWQSTESTDESSLNKTEKAYLDYVKARNPSWVGVHSLTFKLGHDCRFTPDIFFIDDTRRFIAADVKGFMRDDAKAKIQVAARLYPMFTFTIVTRNGTGWHERVVRP